MRIKTDNINKVKKEIEESSIKERNRHIEKAKEEVKSGDQKTLI